MVGVLVRFGCTVSWLPGSRRGSHGNNLFKTASSGARYGGGGEGPLGQKLVRPIFFWTNQKNISFANYCQRIYKMYMAEIPLLHTPHPVKGYFQRNPTLQKIVCALQA